jgi:hypothetical protein
MCHVRLKCSCRLICSNQNYVKIITHTEVMLNVIPEIMNIGGF